MALRARARHKLTRGKPADVAGRIERDTCHRGLRVRQLLLQVNDADQHDRRIHVRIVSTPDYTTSCSRNR